MEDFNSLYRQQDLSGVLRLILPQGNLIGTPKPVTSATRVAALNQQIGLDITPITCVPQWHGERMDLNMAVSGLYDLCR